MAKEVVYVVLDSEVARIKRRFALLSVIVCVSAITSVAWIDNSYRDKLSEMQKEYSQGNAMKVSLK